MNDEIRAKEVQVIGSNGEQLGVMPLDEALNLAESESLDLVEISKNENYKICKIMDYGKYVFDQQKRLKEARKKSKATEVKEIRLSPNIAEHDINFKLKNVEKFLEAGNKVKITMRFRGREIAKADMGKQTMEKFAKALEHIAELDKKPILEGKFMQMVLSKKK